MRRTTLGNAGIVHDNDFIRHRQCLFLVMGDIGHCQAEPLLQLADILAHAAAQFGIEIGQRFVEQQHIGFQHQRARHRNALLLPARQFRRHSVAQALQPDHLEHMLGLVFGHALFQPLHGRPIGDVFQHAHMRKQRIGLKHHRDIAIGRRAQGDILAADENLSCAGDFQTGNHPQGGGLAAARRAEQRHQLAGLDGERHLIDRCDFAVTFADRAEFNRGLAQGQRGWLCAHVRKPFCARASGRRQTIGSR